MRKNFMDNRLFGSVGNFISENGATLSMVGGLISLALALYEAYKASQEVADINEKYAEKVEEIRSEAISEDEKAIKIKDAKNYRRVQTVVAERKTLIFGFVAGGLSILSNHINGATITTLATAAAMKREEIKTFIKNTRETVGEEKFKEIKDKSIEQLISENNFMTPDGPNLIQISEAPWVGDIYLDTNTWRIFQFQGTDEELRTVLKNAEDYGYRCHGIEMSKYFNMLGFELPSTWNKGKGLFWGPNNPLCTKIDTLSVKGATFKAIIYENPPTSAKLAGVPGAI